ncbi:hypothetical protein K9M47_03300, partial [Candidatus Gracilibacteria bacterium]|nr:hypothetical protein [Candidatus Gracilibacteria bacterium]
SATTAFRVANSVGTDALEIKDNGISTFNNRVYQTGLGESTFFGFEAGLNDDLTSNRNSAFGYTALYSNTTGAYNTANGYQSLYSNTTGAYNTANGYEALFSNTTGVYNTANGYQAGRFIADGTTANTTGDYNVFLGADTKALADNDQNEIVIGYNATGLGSNSVVLGNSSIALTRLRGQVGIGTDTPDRLLHAEVSDAVTNAVTYAQRLSHITSGTVAASFGTGTEYELENASNTNRVAGTQEITWSDATDATEDATYTLKLIKAGTLTAGLTVLSTGEATFAGDVSVPDEVYGVGWDASLEVPTKNALYDKIQTLASGTAYTLAGVSALSDDATKSLYTMSAGVPVEFESSDNNTLLYLDETNERVGIGTTAPGAKLEVKSGGTSSYFSNFIPSTGSGFIKIYQDTNSHLSIYGANSAGTTNLVLNTNGVSYLKGGNVLIGSSSDNGNTLQVAGTGYFSGLVGIGTTAPDRLLHAEVSDSGTNSVTYAQRLSHITSGAATTNFGIGVEYELENASGTNRVAGTEEFTWTTATASSESAQYVIQLTRSGTLTDALTLSANAELSTVRYLVEANTAVSASPNIITAAESRKVFTNEGATAQNYHTLPTAVAGLTYTFYVDDADGIRITANTSDIIQINGVASSSAGYAESITIGSSITLTAINSTDWVATSLVGTWNVA